MDMDTRWVPVSTCSLPDGMPATVHHGGHAVWLVDGAEIDARLLPVMGELGSEIKRTLKLLDHPVEPWGEMHLVREDIGLDEMHWMPNQNGIYIPVPKGLISARLVDQVRISATEQLRWTSPLKGDA